MKRPQNVCIIYNPNSTGPSKSAAQRLQKRLQRRMKQAHVETLPTEYQGHAETLAYECAVQKKQPLIVSVSGDGGYHEVINGVMKARNEGKRALCAVLPTGNANDHRRATTHRALHRLIYTDKRTSIDLLEVKIEHRGKMTVRYGHSYVGLGLTPVVAIELNRQKLNALKELLIVVSSFYKFRPFKIKVNKEVLTLDSLIISNIGRMAKFLTFEESRPNDGRFEVSMVENTSKFVLFGRIIRAVFKGLPPSFTTTKYSFTTLKPIPMQIDGEVSELKKGSKVTVAIVPEALETYA